MGDYRKLEVWRFGHETTLAVYEATARFPAHERYGLASQLRRAAESIPANIAEGSGRGSDRDFARFVANGAASANEVEYHLLVARDLGYLDQTDWDRLTEMVRRLRSMLSRLRSSLLAGDG